MKIITSFKKPSFLKRSKTGSSSVTSTFSGSGSGSEPECVLSQSQPTPTSVLPPSITTRELELLLRRLGPDPITDEEVISMLSEADRVGSGSVSYDEIESLGAEGSGSGSDPEELRETFRVFDADGDGRISAEELMRVLATTLGEEECTLEECEGMIRVVGSGGDGSVCFEDFVRMMMMGLER